MPTEILAVNTTAADSSDVVVGSGGQLTACLKDVAGPLVDAYARVVVALKDDAGQYFQVGVLNAENPKAVLTAGTYRFSRVAGASCGVFVDGNGVAAVSATVTIGTSSAVLAAASATRLEITVHNPSATATIAVHPLGGTAALNTGGSITINPGGFFTWSGIWAQQAFNGIASAAASPVTILTR